jgi:hypothetical protein
LLVVLTAGAFTKPGTALVNIDQKSCNSKSPPSEEIQNLKVIILAYDFLNPAVESAYGMSATVAQQFSTLTQIMDGRVSRFASYIFGSQVVGLWCNYFRPSKLGGGLTNEYKDISTFNKLT